MSSGENTASYQAMISKSPVPPIPASVIRMVPIMPGAPVQSPLANSYIAPKLSKKQRHMKGEYKQKLKDENQQLKNQIKELELMISTKEAENNALQNQVQFFQQYMSTAGNDADIVQSNTTQSDPGDN